MFNDYRGELIKACETLEKSAIKLSKYARAAKKLLYADSSFLGKSINEMEQRGNIIWILKQGVLKASADTFKIVNLIYKRNKND